MLVKLCQPVLAQISQESVIGALIDDKQLIGNDVPCLLRKLDIVAILCFNQGDIDERLLRLVVLKTLDVPLLVGIGGLDEAVQRTQEVTLVLCLLACLDPLGKHDGEEVIVEGLLRIHRERLELIVVILVVS